MGKWHREHTTSYQALQAEWEEVLRCDTGPGNNGTGQVALVHFQKVKKGLKRTDLGFWQSGVDQMSLKDLLHLICYAVGLDNGRATISTASTY